MGNCKSHGEYDHHCDVCARKAGIELRQKQRPSELISLLCCTTGRWREKASLIMDAKPILEKHGLGGLPGMDEGAKLYSQLANEVEDAILKAT